MRVGRSGVGSGLAQVDILLVLKRFTSGSIGNPILLVLVEVQHPLQHSYEGAESSGHPKHTVKFERREKRYQCCSRNLDYLDPFIVSLVGCALSVIPCDLIFEPLHRRIRSRCLRGLSAVAAILTRFVRSQLLALLRTGNGSCRTLVGARRGRKAALSTRKRQAYCQLRG